MIKIAITGGVATGKSAAVRLLVEALGENETKVFDCDIEAHKLLTDPEIVAKLTEEFGKTILDPDGNVNRPELRSIALRDETSRLKLEGILHPEILLLANQSIAEAESGESPPEFLLMEIPILYEVEFPVERDIEIVIAASRETQIKRLSENRKLSSESIEQLLGSQLPILTKVDRADIVIWNDGNEVELKNQIGLLRAILEESSFKIK